MNNDIYQGRMENELSAIFLCELILHEQLVGKLLYICVVIDNYSTVILKNHVQNRANVMII